MYQVGPGCVYPYIVGEHKLEGVIRLWGSVIFGTCTTIGSITGKDNMSRFLVQGKEDYLSWLKDHRLRVSVRCMCLISA
jgi:hypothetical protein